MRAWPELGAPPRWVACLEFAEEVFPLVFELAQRHRHGYVPAPSVRDLRSIEPIPTVAGLVEHAGEVAVQRGHRITPSAKTFELRVMAVAPGCATKHGPGQETLTPERHEPARIEVTGMEGPQPHWGCLWSSQRIGIEQPVFLGASGAGRGWGGKGLRGLGGHRCRFFGQGRGKVGGWRRMGSLSARPSC